MVCISFPLFTTRQQDKTFVVGDTLSVIHLSRSEFRIQPCKTFHFLVVTVTETSQCTPKCVYDNKHARTQQQTQQMDACCFVQQRSVLGWTFCSLNIGIDLWKPIEHFGWLLTIVSLWNATKLPKEIFVMDQHETCDPITHKAHQNLW